MVVPGPALALPDGDAQPGIAFDGHRLAEGDGDDDSLVYAVGVAAFGAAGDGRCGGDGGWFGLRRRRGSRCRRGFRLGLGGWFDVHLVAALVGQGPVLQLRRVAVRVGDAPAPELQLVLVDAYAVLVGVGLLDGVGKGQRCAGAAGVARPAVLAAHGQAHPGLAGDGHSLAEGERYLDGLACGVGVAAGGAAGDDRAGGDGGALAALGLYGVSPRQSGKRDRQRQQHNKGQAPSRQEAQRSRHQHAPESPGGGRRSQPARVSHSNPSSKLRFCECPAATSEASRCVSNSLNDSRWVANCRRYERLYQ